VLHAAVLQVQRVRVTLAAIADDGHLLRLDQVDVGITIVIDAHGLPLRGKAGCCWLQWGDEKPAWPRAAGRPSKGCRTLLPEPFLYQCPGTRGGTRQKVRPLASPFAGLPCC